MYPGRSRTRTWVSRLFVFLCYYSRDFRTRPPTTSCNFTRTPRVLQTYVFGWDSNWDLFLFKRSINSLLNRIVSFSVLSYLSPNSCTLSYRTDPLRFNKVKGTTDVVSLVHFLSSSTLTPPFVPIPCFRTVTVVWLKPEIELRDLLMTYWFVPCSC